MLGLVIVSHIWMGNALEQGCNIHVHLCRRPFLGSSLANAPWGGEWRVPLWLLPDPTDAGLGLLAASRVDLRRM